MRTQRVLHICNDFSPRRGGIQDYLAQLTCAQLREPELAPVVLCANDRAMTLEERVHEVPVIRAASYGKYYSPLCVSWPRWIRQLRPSVIHLHLPCPLGEWAIYLARFTGRLIVSLYNDYVRPAFAVKLHYPLHQALLKRADVIIATTPDYAWTSPALRGVRDKVQIIPPCVDLAEYLEGPTAQCSEPRVLSAGRLCYYKGIEVLLRAAVYINGEITIVGDGPWRQRLERQSKQLGLSRRVHFEGVLSETRLIEAMRASRVFVFPSTGRGESFGVSQLKAMACGLPVVSSDLPGVSWLNQHNSSGLHARAGDAKALANQLNRLLKSHALHERLSVGARARARQFHFTSMVRRITELYG